MANSSNSDSLPTNSMPTTAGADSLSPLAAVDMGSNSFRVELGTLHQGRYRRVDYLKETVRLGAGLDDNGLLSDEATERGLACLRRYSQRLAGLAPERVRAVATQTLREARNRDAFLRRAQAALGFNIEVISGREEARLIYAGVAQLQPSEAARLVVDIGGRSTEMILGRGRVPSAAESFQVGSVSLSISHFGDGVLNEANFRAAQVAAGAELEEALQPFAPQHWREALGSSGTVGAVSHLLRTNGIGDGTITSEGLQWCIARCIEAGHVSRLELPGLKDDRRQVIAGGLAILYTLVSQFGVHTLVPAKGALRQGVIVDLHERLQARRQLGGGDMRDESVRTLQQRFGVDTAQADRVRRLALAWYAVARSATRAGEAAGAEPGADVDAERELGWACDLHELGMMVSHHDHHRHSAYLLAHVDAAGFSQSQQRRLGQLVLGQRGGLRKMESDLANPGFVWQLLCLRLAVISCHARDAADAGDAAALTLRSVGLRARIEFSRDWAAKHLRTVYLLEQETKAWSRVDARVLALELKVG